MGVDGNHYNRARRNNNPNDQVNSRMAMDDLCVKDNYGSAEQFLPANGEYVLDGTSGDCYKCINCEPYRMNGMGCDSAGCAWGGGQFPNYKRVSYKADKTMCCTNNGASTVGDFTCDPKYKGGASSNDCNDIYALKCRGAAINTDDCKTWCDRNPRDCESRTRDYCKNNMNLPYCRDKAKSLGGMDTAVTEWCSTHKDDPFCSCYKATFNSSNEVMDAESKAVLSKPECYVKSCSSGSAYQYDNMKTNKACPPVNLCKNTINIVGSNDVNLANVSQSCVQSITQAPAAGAAAQIGTGTTTPATPATKTTSTVTNTKTPARQFLDKYLYYIIAIVVIIVLGIGAAIVFSGDSETDDTGDQHILNLLAKLHITSAPKKKVEVLPSADVSTTLNEL